MSAKELIKQVAALPPQEKAAFQQLYHALANGGRHPPADAPGGNWPDFSERLRKIYGKKVAPDSASIISDGRDH